MLLHDGKSEESIRHFFDEVHLLYIKVNLPMHPSQKKSVPTPSEPVLQTAVNPFYAPGAPITSAAFDARVKALLRKV